MSTLRTLRECRASVLTDPRLYLSLLRLTDGPYSLDMTLEDVLLLPEVKG